MRTNPLGGGFDPKSRPAGGGAIDQKPWGDATEWWLGEKCPLRSCYAIYFLTDRRADARECRCGYGEEKNSEATVRRRPCDIRHEAPAPRRKPILLHQQDLLCSTERSGGQPTGIDPGREVPCIKRHRFMPGSWSASTRTATSWPRMLCTESLTCSADGMAWTSRVDGLNGLGQ